MATYNTRYRTANVVSCTLSIKLQPNDLTHYTVVSIQTLLGACYMQQSIIHRPVQHVASCMTVDRYTVHVWSTDSLRTYQLHICDDISNWQHKGFLFAPAVTRKTINIPPCELNCHNCICKRGETEEEKELRGEEGKREEGRRKGRHKRKGSNWPGGSG